MSLQNWLESGNFKKVQQLSNGGYYCKDTKGNEFYFPPNCSGNMSMVSFLPGDGGSSNDARAWRRIIEGNNPPDYIVAISYTAYHDNANNLLTDTYNALSRNGIKVTDVVQMSFSASGYSCYDSLNRLLTEHPDVNATMVVNNTTNDSSKVEHPENYRAIIDAGVPIIYVDPKGNQHRMRMLKEGEENGYNMYWLQSNSGDHMAYNDDIIINRFADFILGYADEFGNSKYMGGKVTYNLVKLDPETGKYVSADYADLVTSYLGKARIPDLNKILEVDAFDIKSSKVQNDDMGTLAYLKDLQLTSSTGTVSSDLYYVQTSMNEIRSMVKGSSYLTNLSQQGFRSSDGIPGCIGLYVNAYFEVVNALLTTLALESESVLSYAQAMVDMDNDQAAGAAELGKIVETPYAAGTKPESTYVPPKKTDQVYSPDPSNTGCGSSGCGSSGSACGSSGGGCGGASTPVDPGTTVEGEKVLKYKFEDGHHALITYEGATIKEIKYQYKYDNNSEAQKAYPDIFVKYHYEDYVDKLLLNNDQIDVYIKPESYSELEFKEIEKKFLEGAEVEYD